MTQNQNVQSNGVQDYLSSPGPTPTGATLLLWNSKGWISPVVLYLPNIISLISLHALNGFLSLQPNAPGLTQS